VAASPDYNLGAFASEALALAYVQSNRWDVAGTGWTNPLVGMFFVDTVAVSRKWWDGAAWQVIGGGSGAFDYVVSTAAEFLTAYAAAAAGSVIYCKAGTYDFAAQIVLKTGVVVRGAGKGLTIFRFTGASGVFLYYSPAVLGPYTFNNNLARVQYSLTTTTAAEAGNIADGDLLAIAGFAVGGPNRRHMARANGAGIAGSGVFNFFEPTLSLVRDNGGGTPATVTVCAAADVLVGGGIYDMTIRYAGIPTAPVYGISTRWTDGLILERVRFEDWTEGTHGSVGAELLYAYGPSINIEGAGCDRSLTANVISDPKIKVTDYYSLGTSYVISAYACTGGFWELTSHGAPSASYPIGVNQLQGAQIHATAYDGGPQGIKMEYGEENVLRWRCEGGIVTTGDVGSSMVGT